MTAGDFSAVVTGMLLAFNMPVTVPVWVLGAAAVFSILIVKQMFGGIGSNFANPALMGRLLVMVLWPGTVMEYTAPRTLIADAVSQATVLGTVKAGGETGYSYLQMFLGEVPGAMGETSKLLLLVGFAYMCYMGVVNAEAALTYIATVTVLTFILAAGIITAAIRIFSTYPEGICFGILTANCLAGILALLYRQQVYGTKKKAI